VSDLRTDQGGWRGAHYPSTDEEWSTPAGGRHAFNEDAALTPIFHALTRGGWRKRQHEPAASAMTADPVDAFHRDPLTAPIPVQAMAVVPAQPWRRAVAAASGTGSDGRHRRRREPAYR
jgi:hypothetical protein